MAVWLAGLRYPCLRSRPHFDQEHTLFIPSSRPSTRLDMVPARNQLHQPVPLTWHGCLLPNVPGLKGHRVRTRTSNSWLALYCVMTPWMKMASGTVLR